MKVVIGEDLFDPTFLRLNSFAVAALFNYGFDRHALFPCFDSEASRPYVKWVESRPPYEQDAIKMILALGIEAEARGTSENTIKVEAQRTTSDWKSKLPTVTLADALLLLGLPLSVTVEDAENDGAFLRSVVTGPERDEFLAALKKGWIEIRHGGGNTSIRRMVGLTARTVGSRLRNWVLVDGDALAPGRPSAEAKRIMRLCVRNGIPAYALQRRAIENYIPPHHLEEYLPANYPNRQRALGAFFRLETASRHHYSMWGGFTGDADRPRKGDTASAAEVRAVHANVSAADRAALASGFGDEIGKAFSVGVREDRVLRDNIHAELRPVFRRILRWA